MIVGRGGLSGNREGLQKPFLRYDSERSALCGSKTGLKIHRVGRLEFDSVSPIPKGRGETVGGSGRFAEIRKY